MRNCRKCEYCEIDAVSQYLKGIDLHKCIRTGDVILDPFGEGKDCRMFHRKAGLIARIREWLGL